MSVRRPFTKAGRRAHLQVVRPRPFVPPSLAVLAALVLLRPRQGVALVLRSRPAVGRLASWVALAGGLGALPAVFEGGPWWGLAVVWSVSLAFFVWGAAAVVVYGACRLVRRHGTIGACLQVTGVAMAAFPVVGVPYGWAVLVGVLGVVGAYGYGDASAFATGARPGRP